MDIKENKITFLKTRESLISTFYPSLVLKNHASIHIYLPHSHSLLPTFDPNYIIICNAGKESIYHKKGRMGMVNVYIKAFHTSHIKNAEQVVPPCSKGQGKYIVPEIK